MCQGSSHRLSDNKVVRLTGVPRFSYSTPHVGFQLPQGFFPNAFICSLVMTCYYWLLWCIVCLLGIAIPGSLSFQRTQH